MKDSQNLLIIALAGGIIYYYCIYKKKNCGCKKKSQAVVEEDTSNTAYSGLDNAQYEVEGVSVAQMDNIGYADPSAQFAQEALTATTQAQMTTQPYTGISAVQAFATLNAIEGGFQMY